MSLAKFRLLLAAALFLGWLVWLSASALEKNRGPVVSRVQAAAAAHAVVGELSTGPDGKPAAEVQIAETLTEGSPAAGTAIYVMNLAEAKGFDGPGQYLLFLSANPAVRTVPINGKDVPVFAVVGAQRSPGYELANSGSPTIYRWTKEVQAQAKPLFP